MIKRVMETIKEFKEGFKTGFINGFSKQTGYDIDIVYDHNFVHNNGYMYAVCIKNTDGTYKIAVDYMYFTAPKIVRKFIIWHELGHINNDNDGIRSLKCECKADAYAASKIGKLNAVYALNYMWKQLATVNITACVDIPSRLKELGANVSSMYIQLANGSVLHEPELRLISEGINPFTNEPFNKEV